jgi:hypothetical protein
MTFQLSENALENHRRFVERVVKSKIVWGLKGADGWVVCDSSDEEGGDVMPFWSDLALAQRAAVEGWSVYEPTSIPLATFIERWLHGMSEDGTFVGTNWDGNVSGIESIAAELAAELLEALDSA